MGDQSDQIYGKVTDDMNFFEKIASKVPGFSGYVERGKRRDSDKLLRDMISLRFREMEAQVSKLQRDFISTGDLKYVDDLEASAIKMRTFADRVETAPRGYAGLFDSVKINEEELGKLYAYDAGLLDKTDEVQNAIDNVHSSVGTDGLPASIRHLETVTSDCIEAYNHRQEVLTVG
jgi:hypothetical protein